MVYMDDVIPYVESTQIIESQLFALLHSTSDADPVEPVENLMVSVAADLFVIVDETGVNILSRNEFRHNPGILRKNGLHPVHLGFLFPVYPDPVSSLHLIPDIGR